MEIIRIAEISSPKSSAMALDTAATNSPLLGMGEVDFGAGVSEDITGL